MTQPSVHELYQRLETVGKGSYGSVHKGIHRATGNVVALKIIDLDADDGDDVDSIQREVSLLTQLRDGPNITKYYGCHLDGPRVWIVMEFAEGGSVYSLMQASPNNCLEEKYVVVIVREVLIGLNYLHKSNVIHRDIKAANVLVTASGKVIICDFGVSALLATTNSKRNTFIGTPYWMAPEVAQPVPAYDTKADIWSMGIMIYEMVKGSPPHFRVAHLKVIQMIPKVKPPRLAENEGSKDLREFIPFTLTELPSDRLAAEDLLKTKWIKNASRVPITVLKDLLLRYDAWVKTGSKPSDLSEPLPWERENDSDKSEFDENPWEFDTVRGRSFTTSTLESSQVTSNEDYSFTTVRPQPSKLPTSLRHLFDSDAITAPDPFRIQGFSTTNKDAFSSAPGSPLPPPSPAVAVPVPRDRMARRALLVDNNSEDGPNLSTATFAFPPRTVSRGAKTKVGNGLPFLDDQGNLLSHPGDMEKPSTTHNSSLSEATVSGNSIPASAFVASKHQGRRDVRLELDGPGSDVPIQGAGHETKDEGLSVDARSVPATTRRSPASRNRSQSIAQGFPPRPGTEQNPPLPSDFHFPEHSSSSDSNQATSSPGSVFRPRVRISPTRGSSSSTEGSLHSSTHSLDARISAGYPRRPSPPSLTPPALGRSRSTTPGDESPHDSHVGGLKRRPSLHRLASLAVMETPTTASPTKSPAKPVRSRNGNSAGGVGDFSGVPGLKDVLKAPALTSEHQLGMSDLLPPSPTSLHTNLKSFTPSPSHLSSSFVPSGTAHSPAANSSFTSSANSEKNNSVPRALPSPELPSTFPPSVFVSLSPVAHRRDIFLSSSYPPPLPPIRKLDFGGLMASHEETHAELERIVDDLMQWLSIAEWGLTRLLEKPSEDRIDEETEDVDNGADFGEAQEHHDDKSLQALAPR